MWEFVAAVLDLFTTAPPWRVIVKDRYEMKKKVRELKAREKFRAEKAAERNGPCV
jgi:hypothetical protein